MFGFGTKQQEEDVPPVGGPLVLFDIGGTKMRVALSEDGRALGEVKVTATPQDFQEGMYAFATLCRELLGTSRKPVRAVGCVAGILALDRLSGFRLPHLPKWNGKPLVAQMQKAIGAPVTLLNDAALVGLGEWAAGAGRGSNILVYITVSTGVGGARIVRGQLDPSFVGFEPGHQIIDMQSGTDLDGTVSGTAVERRFGVKAYDLSDEQTKIQIADELCIGLYNSVLHWSPDTLVLGGSMIVGERNTLPLGRIEERLHEMLSFLPERPKVRKATLGDLGGLHGALAYARTH